MANFTACVRGSIQDVAGLVLSLDPSSLEEAPERPGYLMRWRNLAAGLPSQPMYRASYLDPVTYKGGRFGSPEQFITDRQPQVVSFGGPRRVRFTRSRLQHLVIPIPAVTFPASVRPWACAFSFQPGLDATPGQTIFADNTISKLKVTRSNGSGDGTVKMNTATLTHAGNTEAGRHLVVSRDVSSNDFRWRRDAQVYVNAAAPANFTMAGPDQAVLGGEILDGTSTPTDPLDGYLDSFHLWSRQLSNKEADFIWQTLGGFGAVPVNAQQRCAVTTARWADRAGSLEQGQAPRLNPFAGVDAVYKRCQLPPSGEGRVQIAMAVDGLVVPDSGLSGNLFTHTWIEAPGTPPGYPVVEKDAGWSSVMDVVVKRPGHYALSVFRPMGGSLIIHFDVALP